MFKRRFLILGITFFLIAIIAYFAIWPGLRTILNSNKEIASRQGELTAASNRQKTIADLRKNSTQIVEVKEIASHYVSDDQESSSTELMVEINEAAKKNNITIENTAITQKAAAPAATTTDKDDAAAVKATATPTPVAPVASASPAGGAKNMDFTLVATGAFPDFLNFLKNLENGPRLLTIKGVTLQSKVEEGKGVTVTAQLQGSVYYKVDVSLTDTLENLKISSATMKKFLDLKNSTTPITLPTGSDFGRGNPFENY